MPRKNLLTTALTAVMSTVAIGWVPPAGYAEQSTAATPPTTLPLPANMVLENVPPIPVALRTLLDRYAFYRQAGCYSWHPTKRELLIGTTFADTSQIHHLTQPMGARTQFTFARERSTDASYQPTQGNYFIFSRDAGGNENYQKYLFSPEAHSETRLTDGKSRNLHTVWSTRGDCFAFSSNARNKDEMDLCLMQPAASPPVAKTLCELHGEGWAPRDWSPDDKLILLHQQVSVNESYFWLVDAATGAKRRFLPKAETKGEQVAYGGGTFSPDGKRVYITCDRDGEFDRLAWVDIATGEINYLTADKWNVDSYALSWDGKQIAYVQNEDGFSVLRMLDTQSGKEIPITATLPKGTIDDLTWHKSNRELAFSFENYATPADVYSLSADGTKLERWTESETGYFNAARDAMPPQLVRWRSFDGKEIPGLLYKPPARFTGKRPAIVMIHGGPEAQSRALYLNKGNYYLNELGVALIYPNIRGSSGYGKSYIAADNGMNREVAFKDIGALLDWIKTQPDLDAGRVMIMGGSYGGFMTLAISTLYSDRIRCSIDIVGISNFITFLENTSGYRRDLRRVEYGDERVPEMREFMKRIAPALNADKIKKPLFVVQGENDPRVPASEALQMVAKVREQGTPVWFLMAKDEGHGFNRKANVDYLFYATVLFVKKFLLDEPAQQP